VAAIPWADLPAWRRRVEGIDNPIRRDLQLFILLTGLRATDAKTVRWEHADFGAGTIHRPRPKGGEERAFTVPVSKAVLDILRRRREENAVIFPRDEGSAWPSRDMSGGVTHVQQVKEQMYIAGRKATAFPSPHRLRDTFRQRRARGRVDWYDLKVLMHHALPSNGDVTMGYVRVSVERGRGEGERVPLGEDGRVSLGRAAGPGTISALKRP